MAKNQLKGTIKRITTSDITNWYQSTIYAGKRILVGYGTTHALALADSLRSINK
jgi:molybdopterin-binding protein